jgi:hypothetical protein
MLGYGGVLVQNTNWSPLVQGRPSHMLESKSRKRRAGGAKGIQD